MPIDPEAVGLSSPPVERSWGPTDAILYALAVGAGTAELAFTTENTEGVDQQVLPTFAVVPGAGGGLVPQVGTYDPAMAVHGAQSVELLLPLPVRGRVRTVETVTAIHDKGSGALIRTETAGIDADSEQLLFRNEASFFIRGEGGWGGDRGPSAEYATPSGAADVTVTERTDDSQALLYRLCGDRNPLHSDPVIASRAGYERPILHGLCTFGFAGRALLHGVCDSDVGAFVRMEGRFSGPVYPGDTLETRIWNEGRESRFLVRNQHGELVMDRGLFVST